MIMTEASNHFAVVAILRMKDALTELISVCVVVSNCVSSLMWVIRIADFCIGLKKDWPVTSRIASCANSSFAHLEGYG